MSTRHAIFQVFKKTDKIISLRFRVGQPSGLSEAIPFRLTISKNDVFSQAEACAYQYFENLNYYLLFKVKFK